MSSYTGSMKSDEIVDVFASAEEKQKQIDALLAKEREAKEAKQRRALELEQRRWRKVQSGPKRFKSAKSRGVSIPAEGEPEAYKLLRSMGLGDTIEAAKGNLDSISDNELKAMADMAAAACASAQESTISHLMEPSACYFMNSADSLEGATMSMGGGSGTFTSAGPVKIGEIIPDSSLDNEQVWKGATAEEALTDLAASREPQYWEEPHPLDAHTFELTKFAYNTVPMSELR